MEFTPCIPGSMVDCMMISWTCLKTTSAVPIFIRVSRKECFSPLTSRHAGNHGAAGTSIRTNPLTRIDPSFPWDGPVTDDHFSFEVEPVNMQDFFLHSSSPLFFLRERLKTLIFWGSSDARSAQGISFRQGKLTHSEQNATPPSPAHRKVAHCPSITGQKPSVTRHPGQEAFSLGIRKSCATRTRRASSVPAR